MHKAAIAALILGAMGLVASAGSIYFGIQSEIEYIGEQARSDEFGEELWTGNTPTRFEGELSFTNIYFVFIEETRDADVTLIGEDDANRFNPCDSGRNAMTCDMIYREGGLDYRILGTIEISDAGDWEVVFSGDVTGGSKVMIRELPMFNNGVKLAGLGCFGSVFSCLALLVGIILVFTLKENKAPSKQFVYTPGSIVSEDQQDGPSTTSDPS